MSLRNIVSINLKVIIFFLNNLLYINMNNKIINPLTGKYVNIDSNEGREIINYYTHRY